MTYNFATSAISEREGKREGDRKSGHQEMSNQCSQRFVLCLPVADDVNYQPRHPRISRRVCEIIPTLPNLLKIDAFVEVVDFEHRVFVTHNISNMFSNHGENRGLELTAERIGLALATRGYYL